jgi:hypothetical protein
VKKNLLACFLALVSITGCGYSHRNNELVGQPKSIEQTTPILCPEQNILHMSLGVMRNGVGSMSTEDVMINIPDNSMVPLLKEVVKDGKLINAVTNQARMRWCNCEVELVSFQVIKDETEKK